MKKSLSFVAVSSLVFSILFFVTPKLVLADGMVLTLDPYLDRWDYSGENNQQAFINHDNGLQKMIISIGLEGKNTKGAVWLFPIPANPNKIAIDVVKSIPNLRGVEVHTKAKKISMMQ